MVKVNTKDGDRHVTWREAQHLAATGIATIVQGDAATESGPEYEKMTRAELDALANERGVDVTSASTKADVIAALRS